MRRACNFWGELSCELTRAKRRTLRHRYTDLYAAFGFSVVIHTIGRLYFLSEEHALYQGVLYAIQLLMITLEDFVIYLGKSVGLQQNRKCLAIFLTKMRMPIDLTNQVLLNSSGLPLFACGFHFASVTWQQQRVLVVGAWRARYF